MDNKDMSMMHCGHVANGQTEDGKLCCTICYGVYPGADITLDSTPEFKNRQAKCNYNNQVGDCKSIVPSRLGLPFFEHKPDEDFDRYYCGCFGWG